MASDSHPPSPANALAQQTSPYLLQHAHNPVQWQPWSDAAFEQARQQDKPIFLSVGYSTCHWCHVMAHESFEDADVATALNEHFVPIKVDREELPDVDAQYMLATQAFYTLMQQPRAGGWPNSVWLMPDGRPFYAGTYFPRAMFVDLLEQLAAFWRDQRENVGANAEAITPLMRQMAAVRAQADATLGPEMVDRALAMMADRFDTQHGGFAGRPKFPPHSTLGFLTAMHKRQPEQRLRHMIAATLEGMSRGGIYDHVGGGFHRYSTDDHWFLPHFEKMLYDNAQLITAYARGYQITAQPDYRRVVDETFDWLSREMIDAAGGFYSAIDADSEGKEGKFYVWAADEILDLLGADQSDLFIEAYGIKPKGNWQDEATGEPEPTNVPYLPRPLDELAKLRGVSTEELRHALDSARQKLLAVRETRIRPHRDDKLLVSWNGLMIGALAEAGAAMNESRYLDAAGRAAQFILDTMIQPDGQLQRVYRMGQAKQPGYLDDYAYFADGLIKLHRAAKDPRWLDAARQIAGQMVQRFADIPRGGFYFTSAVHDEMILRSKNPHAGGNQPHVNGIAASVVMQIGQLDRHAEYLTLAENTVRLFAGQIAEYPMGNEELILVAIGLMDAGALERDAGAAPMATEGQPPLYIEAFVAERDVDLITLSVRITIDPPYHIYGPAVDDASLTATTVTLAEADGVELGDVTYPQTEPMTDPVADRDIPTYRGSIAITVRLKLTGQTPADVAAMLRVHAQPCDDRACLKPQTVNLRIALS